MTPVTWDPELVSNSPAQVLHTAVPIACVGMWVHHLPAQKKMQYGVLWSTPVQQAFPTQGSEEYQGGYLAQLQQAPQPEQLQAQLQEYLAQLQQAPQPEQHQAQSDQELYEFYQWTRYLSPAGV